MNNLYIGSNGKVAAIDIKTGTEIWVTELKTGDGFFSSRPYEDVTVLEELPYLFAGCNGHLYCIDAQSGKILWHNKLKGWGNNDLSMSIGGKQVQSINKTKIETKSS